jgi:transcriptional regulator with XRE-family HTH domain
VSGQEALSNLTMSRKLQNYVRSYRRRSGLSQEELAFLLGCQNGSKVSRYECFERVPALETALAYEAVFGASTRELFAGVYEQTLTTIQERAKLLAQRLAQSKSDTATTRKIELLTSLSSSRSAKETNS